MTLQDFVEQKRDFAPQYGAPPSHTADDVALIQEFQRLLVAAGFLDPKMWPSEQADFTLTKKWLNGFQSTDGRYGAQTKQAARAFRAFTGVQEHELSWQCIQALLGFKKPILDDFTQDALKRIISYVEANNMYVCLQAGAQNIVYLEGVNPMTFQVNADKPDQWNDLRLCFTCHGPGHFEITHVAQATTEPGKFYTENPINPAGTARIAFGQYRAWRYGVHNGKHAALVQKDLIVVHRDRNRNYIRDKMDYIEMDNDFGLNQHTTWAGFESESIGRASAGCLVGKYQLQHLNQFMPLVLSDPRYLVDSDYPFISAVLPGDKVFAQ
jgi:hypothetical protein